MRVKVRNDVTPRIAALDTLRANVMIADRDLNITYINPAVAALLREAEAELKKALPRFSMATLIGSNIDVFHKTPSHQRMMLSTLTKAHAATIRIGERVFDLLVTPLMDKGVPSGFVVEWADAKERMQNADYAASAEALSRSMAVIEFTPDGTILTANSVFLSVIGYTLDEVKGRHHSMFVEPALKESQEYAEFWEKLRRGEFQAARFKRVGKGGKAVWIEGSYSPVLDASGKVAKLIKVASDVTKQMTLLGDLKTLIDQNFAEIDNALHLSTSEAQSAASAAGETTTNVQSVATSADELAASIREVSQSMAKSRSATENAFGQIVAVGKNTESLANAAQAMNGIVALIRNVASQINLLALNATIESARAGDAGKGFAVVASEVKNLAVQAANATEQIAREIEGMQATSSQVVSGLEAIRNAVTTVRESVTVTASAVEEQTAVTQAMSANMQAAADAVSTVSANISEISTAVYQVAQAVSKTKQAAQVLVR